MTTAPERVGAIVLAGGRSSRFGRNKLAEPIGGRAMLDLAVDAVRTVATDVVVVTSPDGGPELPADVIPARDTRAFEGPLAGLAAGLRALDEAVTRAVVVGGDMPALQPAVLGRLVDRLVEADIAVLEDDDGPRPLPMAVRRASVRPIVERLLADGERSLRALLAETGVALIGQATWRRDDPEGRTLLDVDVPGDLPG